MNDGLDGRETVAFGLAAGEVAVFVLALMAAYAALRSGVPGAIAWCLAAVLATGGAALAWGRLAGRPLLEWAVLLARFLARTRRGRAARIRHRVRMLRPAGSSAQSGALVIPLALRRHDAVARQEQVVAPSVPLSLVAGDAPPRVEAAAQERSHVVVFFSLNGGTGRSTLAVEVAALLATRWRVALLDLTERSPAVALRLGIPLPIATPDDATLQLISHDDGLLVFAGSPSDLRGGGAASPSARTALAAAERSGAGVVVVDVDCDLGDRCLDALQRADQVYVTLTPSAGGALDAYRSTAALRRLGLRDRVGYVVNRWRDGTDLGEAMADLGGSVAAEIPEHDAFVHAENHHRLAAQEGARQVTAALERLAATVEWAAARRSRRVPLAGSHAG